MLYFTITILSHCCAEDGVIDVDKEQRVCLQYIHTSRICSNAIQRVSTYNRDRPYLWPP